MKKKSRADIIAQANRLLEMAQRDNFELNDRQNRIIDIASRYEENIMRTRHYRNDANATATSIGLKRHENYERMQNRRYSRNTYMGLNNG